MLIQITCTFSPDSSLNTHICVYWTKVPGRRVSFLWCVHTCTHTHPSSSSHGHLCNRLERSSKQYQPAWHSTYTASSRTSFLQPLTLQGKTPTAFPQLCLLVRHLTFPFHNISTQHGSIDECCNSLWTIAEIPCIPAPSPSS